jgi:chaperonin GroES
MTKSIDSVDKLIVVGDRVLIKPKSSSSKTRSGLFLPPGYNEKEVVQSGYVVKVGPGYPIPVLSDEDVEPWKQKTAEHSRYLPLQVKPGDLAIFLQKSAIEIIFNDQRYYIVPQSAILLLERDDFTVE